MFQRGFALLLGAMLAFPAVAQDAEPLELGPGMRAYTTRVFVEPEVLAELSVGDEVSVYTTVFTAWDYPHASGFKDTYVVELLTVNLQLIAISKPAIQVGSAELVEVPIRFGGYPASLHTLSLASVIRADSPDFVFFYPRRGTEDEPFSLSSNGMLVLTRNSDELPEFCQACETLLLEDYHKIYFQYMKRFYRTERRGVEVTRIEVPCRDD